MNVVVQQLLVVGAANGVVQSTVGLKRPAFDTASSIPLALEFKLIERDA